ncbi:hypothetical protein HHK36_015266 [Tetracentron sinense]|uniref:Thioredoxin domain-containing protein n=1 Tax=Tetracentron sinense TaxID=13715 RepID=A0A834Z4T7_TETSI|nr:hypothetical protein HHK36_015266 [Tetracentron sinense]
MGLFLSRLCGNSQKHNKSSGVITIHSAAQWKEHFDAFKESNQLLVIDFSASWCGPCRYMEPILKKYAVKFKDVEFVTIDVDELTEVAQQFEVTAMPTFILMKHGKEVYKIVGADKKELKKKIKEHKV